MKPGPDQIISCPHCKGIAKYRTLTSGNTLGATFWSDGKKVFPMLALPPAVIKCQHCEKSYWLTDAEKVGTVKLRGEEDQKAHPEWTAAKQIEEPTEGDYYSAIEANLAKDRGQEKLLRILAWWRRNDAHRTQEEIKVSVSDTCRENLEALLRLIDQENDEDRLMKGEVLRELGQFEDAKQVLNSVASAKHAYIVRQIISLCANKESRVSKFQLGN